MSVRLNNFLSIKCKQPIVVFESDDWGMRRKGKSDGVLTEFGDQKFYADDQLESTDDLNAIFKLLAGFHDSRGNPWKITANFVVENPDFERTIAGNYHHLYWEPFDNDVDLVRTWNLGYKEKVFYPQYHGRTHFNPFQMDQDLREDLGLSRKVFQKYYHGGENNLRKGGWRLHSEYVLWEKPANVTIRKDPRWIEDGLEIFRRTFGFRPESTIPPHYIADHWTLGALKEAGIKYLQSGSQLYFVNKWQRRTKRRLPQGFLLNGLLNLKRNIRFEPCRNVSRWDVKEALRRAKLLFKKRYPVVIDTHRINYVGRFRDLGLSKLGDLIFELGKYNPLVLSTDELGEAVVSKGSYTNRFTGEGHKIQLSRFYW